MQLKQVFIRISLIVITIIISYGFSSIAFQKIKWIAPNSANTIKNPTTDMLTSIKEGKKLYKSQCLICHGAKGNGKGIAGVSLTPKPADFTSETIQSQTDGALFWKLTTGNSPMAAYKDILTEKQRWDLVNYIRTFKK